MVSWCWLVTKLPLPAVTLSIIATRDHVASAHAFNKCLSLIDFRNSLVFTDKPEYWRDEGTTTITQIPPFEHYHDVCVWSLTQGPQTFLPLIGTHQLCIGWDGWPVHADAWTDEFLSWDFIGSPFPNNVVGNNGFCLVSRKYWEGIESLHLPPEPNQCFPSDQKVNGPYRAQLEAFGVRFAPVELARRFSEENNPPVPSTSLGFHGKLSLADICKQGKYL